MIGASLTIALGLLTFIGWISGLALLASVRAKYIPMARSTALRFSVIGLGLIAHIWKAELRSIPRFGACIVLAVACAKLVEIFGGFHFGIDAWFVRNPELFGAVPTGRMALLTASNFIFIALALLALIGSQRAKFGGPSGRSPHSSARSFSSATGMGRPCFTVVTSSRSRSPPLAVFFCRSSGSRQRRARKVGHCEHFLAIRPAPCCCAHLFRSSRQRR